MTGDGGWDAIVVGAGVGGLVCAGYLAATGRRVLVLEQHDVAGGNCHVFRRRRTYEFDVGLHYLGDCGADGILPAILSGLGVGDRVRFVEMTPGGFDRIILPGLTVDVPAGWDRYRVAMMAALPGEADAVAAFCDIAEGVAVAARATLLGHPLPEAPRLHSLTWSHRSLAELFDHCGLSTLARAVLDGQAGNYGSPPAATSVRTHVTVLDHYLRGAFYPEGGGQRLIAALVEALEAHGGRLSTRTHVERILIEGGSVHGVVADGVEYRAPLVISNADYRRTVLELCGGEAAFPRGLVRRTRQASMRMAFHAVYVGLDVPLPDVPNANIWWYEDADIDRIFERAAKDDPQEVPYVYLSFTSKKDPAGADAGLGNFQIMTMRPPAPEPERGYRRYTGYLATKQSFTDAMISAAERVIGPFRDHIAHLEAATPYTHQRYTLSSGGTPYGMGRWGPLGARPDVRTSVSGLYVVGQNTRYGSGIGAVAISGAVCAGHIVGRQLLAEVHSGSVIGKRELLPVRGPDFDPLSVSRGAARRTARGLARISR